MPQIGRGSGGDVVVAARRGGVGLMGKADIFHMRKKISDRSPFYWRCCRKGREGEPEAEPEGLPGDDKVELDPTAAS